MKFGLGPLTTQIPASDKRTPFGKYKEAIELARMAEDLGYHSVWVSEHHGDPDNYLSSLFTLCSAIAQETERIRIGTYIALAPFYDPLRLASDAASVDLLSGGRFVLGLGLGYRDREFERYFQVPKSERVRRTTDAIEICRRAWEGETFSYEGDVFQYEDIRVNPAPTRGSDLPIYLAAVSEPAIRRTVRRADGVLFNTFSFVERLGESVALVEDEGADRGEFEVIDSVEISVGDTREEAWQKVSDGAKYVHSRYAEEAAESSDPMELPGSENAQSVVQYGPAEQLIEDLEPYQDLLGSNGELIAWIDHPGMRFEDTRDSVRRFALEVIPHLC